MMGLLDGITGSTWDDPRTMATLAAAQALMGRGSTMQRLAGGMQGYGGAMEIAKARDQELARRELEKQMQQIQLQQMLEAAAAQKEAKKQSATDMQLLRTMNETGGSGPTMPPDPRLFLERGGSLPGLQNMLGVQAALAPPAPKLMSVAPGNTVIDERTGKTFFSAPDKPKEINPNQPFLLIDGKIVPNKAYQDYELLKTRTGKAETNVNVNTAKPLMNTMAEGLGKQIDSSLTEAKSAIPAIQTAHTLRAAVDSGKITAGPGASFRVLGLQIGQMLGVGGKDGAEILSNTRTAIQSMAQAELAAAQMMRGQGQITEAERDIIRRAAAGNIDNLTAPEIRQLSEAMEKTARFKISQHKNNLQSLSKIEGFAPLMPLYQLPDVPTYSGPAGSGSVRRYNPATGKIE